MASREELLHAIRVIKSHCDSEYCCTCVLRSFCKPINWGYAEEQIESAQDFEFKQLWEK